MNNRKCWSLAARMTGKLALSRRTHDRALKWPQGMRKINVLHADKFQSDTWLYNGFQIGCPMYDARIFGSHRPAIQCIKYVEE
jgi:hypothetical protein